MTNAIIYINLLEKLSFMTLIHGYLILFLFIALHNAESTVIAITYISQSIAISTNFWQSTNISTIINYISLCIQIM